MYWSLSGIGQKETGREAAAATQGLYRDFSGLAPDPNDHLRLPPDPVRMAEAPYWEYHELAIEKRRADVLRQVAAYHLQISALHEVGATSAAVVLRSYPRIGERTIAENLTPSHGDPDRPSVGDFHLKHMVAFPLAGKSRGTDDEMRELLEPFRSHRGRVARLLHTLGYESRFRAEDEFEGHHADTTALHRGGRPRLLVYRRVMRAGRQQCRR